MYIYYCFSSCLWVILKFVLLLDNHIGRFTFNYLNSFNQIAIINYKYYC